MPVSAVIYIILVSLNLIKSHSFPIWMLEAKAIDLGKCSGNELWYKSPERPHLKRLHFRVSRWPIGLIYSYVNWLQSLNLAHYVICNMASWVLDVDRGACSSPIHSYFPLSFHFLKRPPEGHTLRLYLCAQTLRARKDFSVFVCCGL